MKIFVLTSRFPYPIEKGDKLRIYHQIRELSTKHEIVLCSLYEDEVHEEDLAALQKYCSAVHLFRLSRLGIAWHLFLSVFHSFPFQVAYFYRRRIHRKIEQIIQQEEPDHIYCQLIRMAEYVRFSTPNATIDYMDTMSIGMARRAEKSQGLSRVLFRRETNKVRCYERMIFQLFAHHTIISEQDRDLLPVAHPEKVCIIPNGVDTTYFQPNGDKEARYDIVFVGNMGYFPNVEAAKFLINQIMPIVWERRPNARVLIAGARPAMEVKELGGPLVEISGWVEDIRTAYTDGKLFVAPLFTGSGQQNKILEAMASATPVITTSLVNNAIGANVQTEILVAESARSFAKQIVSTLADTELRDQLACNARKFVCLQYGWKSAVQKLENIWKKKYGIIQ